MTEASATHLVLIPSYNTGPRLVDTVREARAHWTPVWVVLDGSTDGSGAALPRDDPGLRVIVLPRNGGKGAAVLHGLRAARAEGFTHALVMDADGQHPAALIPEFMAASRREPDAMILGRPVFGPEAPLVRVMERTRWMRRYDFDAEAAVRLVWEGARPVNIAAPVRYLKREEGGVSHFRYGRDNLLLSFMHARLMMGMLRRLPRLARQRRRMAARRR